MARAAFTILALLLAAACQTVVDVGPPCDTNLDCHGAQCRNGFCDVGAVGGEGEGASGGDGEGEGASGGDGEGEGASGGNGEGEGAGAGEGEGAGAGEGEGEGVVDELPPRSCLDLLTKHPGTATGDYALDLDGDGLADGTFHCDMTTDGGGFTRIFFLDQTTIAAKLAAANPADPACPGEWQLVDKRTDPTLNFIGCDRNQGTGGARSAVIPAVLPYTDVMGTVTGIMFGDADAFFDIPSNAVDDGIDAAYADGVAVTTSSTAGPRQHVFTYLASHPLPNQINSECPCQNGAPQAPSFVGDQLFCATASCKARDSNGSCSAALNENERFFDPSTPVWSGNEICSPPAHAGDFFIRDAFFATATETDLELRIMDDQASSDEDMAVVHAELYVR